LEVSKNAEVAAQSPGAAFALVQLLQEFEFINRNAVELG
jgi:hypothetical protein